jgi:hypothetical protein
MAEQTETVTMKMDKECKGSIRYVADKDNLDAVVSNVYLSRSFSRPMPEVIQVSVKAVK